MKDVSRRSFLRSASAITAGAVIIPNLLSASPSKKINVAIIGVGGRGKAQWSSCNEDNIVAMCDVDENRASEGFNAFPKAKRYKDFRKMFDEMAGEIDAVMVSTPDHTHFPAAMAAMQLGKHIFVEKPLAHNIWQLRTLKKAAHHYKVISQMGNQGHATDGIRRVKEWYEAGVLGDVKEILAWFNGPSFGPDKYFNKPEQFPPAKEPIPAGFDWDLWLGPAANREYSHYYAPKTWRGFYDFGMGELGDWACHTLDAPFWALDLGMPNVVETEFTTGAPAGFLPDQSIIRFEFPTRGSKPPATLTWYEGGIKPKIRPEWKLEELTGSGMMMIGEKQNIITGGRPNDAKLMMPDDEWENWKANEMPEASIPRVDGGPQREFLNAIKGDGPLPGSNFDYATRLTEMATVGVLSQRFNARIEYDDKNMKVTNHPEMDKYVKEPVRKGWEYGEEVW
ncbi:MAG: Gfo/Idh/MocA family oxidoreductase [Prolixibacteraceae bacterium]|jgi:predicted dehydrogenase|nr:Gfo/Idh/MocA family oxidoreductase [Prolixibacteraceae bacterium]MBT6007003.1 Gfo/Idh/MocA family oxidoreductase [Prolixibacteraceae bacterium]MBT6764747.1 Gfo/Idh/MocA family oxidoreductase [Prolixibacteraceae bacterium]MBT7000717.1 Gfo/Idh/MocA family oxidoreductase [Prolixibacteraceae bacterium]MBT7395305.1 Gfo/Idh/MocA family oxidoreductase [Prolixibacteraceae bacterium]